MTAREFARAQRVTYGTVMNWLKRGIVPGAMLKQKGEATYWYIPETALHMELPKTGPKPGANKDAAQASTKKRATKKAN